MYYTKCHLEISVVNRRRWVYFEKKASCWNECGYAGLVWYGVRFGCEIAAGVIWTLCNCVLTGLCAQFVLLERYSRLLFALSA